MTGTEIVVKSQRHCTQLRPCRRHQRCQRRLLDRVDRRRRLYQGVLGNRGAK